MTDTSPRATGHGPRVTMSREDVARLENTWRKPTGLRAFFTDVHHTTLGRRFVITAFIFFILGGIEALLMRIQLARPEQHFLNPDLYNQIFTTHGSTMMFLFAVPVMEGIGLSLVPLMIGTRNSAFPRLNQFAYFTYLAGGVLLYASLFLNFAPDAGWFSYVPLAGPEYAPGKRVDIWAQMITFTEMSALAAAVSMVATIFTQRAPGMSLNRMPLFVWGQLVTAFMIIFAMPAVMVGSLYLATDRLIATHFFNQAEGGDPLLWQHMFWYFAHPEVYIIFIPGTTMMTTLIEDFTKRKIFGYTGMVLALVSTGFIGFGVWVHHMFATGIPQMGSSFFTASSVLITIPTGYQFFSWIVTLWRGKIEFKAPLYYAFGMIAIFLIGGLTGVMLASVPLNLQLHDTFFVVAHLHYVLIGGAIFPLLGAVLYWYPKVTGRMPSERLGKLSFWLTFIGFNLTFFPMHTLGLRGMPRRDYTYLASMNWGDLNLLATIGAGILGIGVLVYVINALVSLRSGEVAGANPWGGYGLEWATSSPPPPYNFAELPTVRDRYALWTSTPDQPVVVGLRTDRMETLVTRLLDAEPDHVVHLPHATPVPFLVTLASAIGIITAIFTPWGVPLGAVLVLPALVAWFWPHPPHQKLLKEQP